MINCYYRELLNKQQAYVDMLKKSTTEQRVLWKCQLSHVRRYLRQTLEITILTWVGAAPIWLRTQEPCDKTRVLKSISMAIGYLRQRHAGKSFLRS